MFILVWSSDATGEHDSTAVHDLYEVKEALKGTAFGEWPTDIIRMYNDSVLRMDIPKIALEILSEAKDT